MSTEVDTFLAKRGIRPAVWLARGCLRYEAGDEWVKDEFSEFFTNPKPGYVDSRYRLQTVSRIVNQSAGWLMPKHPPPGFPPIPPQLRPDDPVILDRRPTWHYHGPIWSEWPVYPQEAGTDLVGKSLPRRQSAASFLYGAAADRHVDAGGDDEDPYDPATGLGSHKGVPCDVVHRHAPREAKYVLLGKGQRIDLHPLALQRLPGAEVVHFVLEGTPKNDSVLSKGGVPFSVPSVTMWDKRELLAFARQYLRDKTVIVVPDSDWASNWQVIRQALRVRTLLRRHGIDAYIAAPPQVGGKKVGVDDFLGADGALDEMVMAGCEPPGQRILAATSGVQYQQRGKATEVLENLSLYARKDGTLRVTFATLKGLLEIRDSYRVIPTLDAISHCFTIDAGSLDTTQQQTPDGRRITVWKNTPTIKIDDYYKAQETRERLLVRDFWQETAFDLLREVNDLRQHQRDVDARDDIAA